MKQLLRPALASALGLVFAPSLALAQEAPAPGAAAPPAAVSEAPAATAAAAESPATPACCVIPAGSSIRVELGEEISTKTIVRGAQFKIRLGAPIIVNGVELAPKGASGIGEVVHVAKGGAGGKPAELIVAARYVNVGDTRVPIRGFKLTGMGEDRGGEAMAVMLAAGVASMLVRGGDLVMPEGAWGYAKVASDVTLPTPPPQAAPATEVTQAGKSDTP